MFEVFLTDKSKQGQAGVEESAAEVLAVASHVFVSCSALSDEQVMRVLKDSFKNELPARAFLIRPYAELWQEFISEDSFEPIYSEGIWHADIQLRQHDELRWPRGPGPGYSKERAYEFIANRYRRAIVPVRKSLLRYRKSAQFVAWVKKLQDAGMLDWQILNLINNAVLNYRIGGGNPIYDPQLYRQKVASMIDLEESETDLAVPEEFIFDQLDIFKKTSIASNASTWGLSVRQQTPNFTALEQLLDIRFFQATDDVPHEDLFSAL